MEQIPVADRCLLQQGMVALGDGRPVGQVVDVRLLADEGQIGIGEGVQSGWPLVAGRRYQSAGAYGRLGHSHAGHGRQETSSAAEMYVRRLVTDS